MSPRIPLYLFYINYCKLCNYYLNTFNELKNYKNIPHINKKIYLQIYKVLFIIVLIYCFYLNIFKIYYKIYNYILLIHKK